MFSSRLYEVVEHVSSRCHPNQDLDASPAPALAVWPQVNYVTIVVFGSLILKIKMTASHLTHLSCRWNGCAWRWGSSSLHHRSQFRNWSDHTGPLWKAGRTHSGNLYNVAGIWLCVCNGREYGRGSSSEAGHPAAARVSWGGIVQGWTGWRPQQDLGSRYSGLVAEIRTRRMQHTWRVLGENKRNIT